jgi:flavin-binding protein dodecin
MSDHVYKIVEIVGSSKQSSDAAIENAIAKLAESGKKLDWFQVVETRGHIVEGKVGHYQVILKVGFRLEE